MDLALGDIRILEHLLDWWHTSTEVWATQFLELGTGEVGCVILTLGKGLTENFGLEGT